VTVYATFTRRAAQCDALRRKPHNVFSGKLCKIRWLILAFYAIAHRRHRRGSRERRREGAAAAEGLGLIY